MFQSSDITRINQVLGEKFQHKDGPFFRSLDSALAKLHVERQAYHGGTLVGNHVHKLVKVNYYSCVPSMCCTTFNSTCIVIHA